MVCQHLQEIIDTQGITLPNEHRVVYREECTKCFATDSQGLNLCIKCWNGSCAAHTLAHASLCREMSVINIKKHRVEKASDSEQDRPAKITKLAIGKPGGFQTDDIYETVYEMNLCCLRCTDDSSINIKTNEYLVGICQKVLQHRSASETQAIQAWEDERISCEHILTLKQCDNPPQLATKELAHCSKCDLNSNLWLCLTCGALGCGRPIYGGGGGNGHAVEHYNETKHPLVCKLGTITPEGEGDVNCYLCDEMRRDDALGTHLSHFGILLANQKKTDKSMAEMEIETNMNHEWSQVIEKGQALQLVWGPNRTGLINIGNSCYMASVFQVLFSLDSFRKEFYEKGQLHLQKCTKLSPAICYECQISKLAHGLASGEYSKQPPELQQNDVKEIKQPGIEPRMFKHLVSESHAEFRSTRQQDAFEFFQYFLEYIQREQRKKGGVDPTVAFNYKIETRIECTQCHRVRYKSTQTSDISIPLPTENLPENKESDETIWPTVSIQSCLSEWSRPIKVENYQCSQCQSKTTIEQQQRFETFPQVLVAHTRRFVCPDWVPIKLNTNIQVPPTLDLKELRGTGIKQGELELPNDDASGGGLTSFQANPEFMSALQAMGFGDNRCVRALHAVDNASAEVAMEWLFAHMEDPDIDLPLELNQPTESAAAGSQVDLQAVENLMAMGFDQARCEYALEETNNNLERAVDWLFSHADQPLPSKETTAQGTDVVDQSKYRLVGAILHLGRSTGFGHYVAYVLDESTNQWIYFNDSKVAISPTPPLEKAYLYVLKRV